MEVAILSRKENTPLNSIFDILRPQSYSILDCEFQSNHGANCALSCMKRPKHLHWGPLTLKWAKQHFHRLCLEQSTLLVSLGKDIEITPEIFRRKAGVWHLWLLKSGVEKSRSQPGSGRTTESQAHVLVSPEGI